MELMYSWYPGGSAADPAVSPVATAAGMLTPAAGAERVARAGATEAWGTPGGTDTTGRPEAVVLTGDTDAVVVGATAADGGAGLCDGVSTAVVAVVVVTDEPGFVDTGEVDAALGDLGGEPPFVVAAAVVGGDPLGVDFLLLLLGLEGQPRPTGGHVIGALTLAWLSL